ncbi:helix-turn-helix domain-containing protein [Pseudomonas citronellolis]|uniref:helix-turn-helix domain-containing protein n=1 Tax=Pseudomonas citronellolis TaxID=53408 RepID=UPI00209CDAEF|nr:helix-turn-helix transcriptional regulator [Pseudomonas citronellolis]MCP1605739.1 transcriptional regulator with XRE-family HTH domain [Pseudomonas citronellolis]MCP1656106.1 transcriptional regulator with XRE-family HTH domain [Pseudomonas citronellolis]MCP1722266.1 transcriptional regulator with XRE-family HTH domain [Pseudomonas citronellolis]
MTTIGDRLKEERVRLGLSQTDLGAVGGVGKTTQINYEKGERSPDATYLSAAAQRGVDVLYVLTGKHVPAEPGSITAEEFDVLRFLRLMPEEDRKVVMRMAHALFVASTSPQAD